MPSQGTIEERSVKDVDWVGWNHLTQLVEKTYRTNFETGDEQFKRRHAKGLILVGFKTGGRISEILPLTRDKFSFDGEYWTVTMPLVKQYKKIESVKKWKCEKCSYRWEEKPTTIIDGSAEEWRLECPVEGHHNVTDYEGFRSKKKEGKRTVDFPKDEPLNDEFREYVESCDELLFPHPTREGEIMKRSYAYTLVTAVDSDIWLHWLRAQRASQMAEELGFDLEDRMKWFAWENDKYPRIYGSKKYELREKMSNPKRRIR